MAAAGEGPVRPALRRGREEPARDGAGRPPVHLRRPAPHQVLRGGVRLHAQEARGVDAHRRGDLRGVPARPALIARLLLLFGALVLSAASAGGATAQTAPRLTVPPG